MKKKDFGCLELLKIIEENKEILNFIKSCGFEFNDDCGIYFNVYTHYDQQPPLNTLLKIKEIFKADDVVFIKDEEENCWFNIKISSWFE